MQREVGEANELVAEAIILAPVCGGCGGELRGTLKGVQSTVCLSFYANI